MARIDEVMVAFLEGRKRKQNAHETDGQTYWLHGHAIIQKDGRTFIIDCCGYPTPTTFDVLNKVTCVSGGKQERGHYDYRSGRTMSLYKGLCIHRDGEWEGLSRKWDGEATKLRMDEVNIAKGLPGAVPWNDICKTCALYTGDDGQLTCGHHPDYDLTLNKETKRWDRSPETCEYRMVLSPVEGGFQNVAFYEEYETAAERRRACKGAMSRQPTGKARGYIIVDRRQEMMERCTWKHDAYGTLMCGYEPGSPPGAIVHHPCGFDYLNSPLTRRVGAQYMPRDWFKALMDVAYFQVRDGKLYDVLHPSVAEKERDAV